MTEDIIKTKILIVDDEEKNIKLIKAILENYDFSFETAKNGLEALEKTKDFNPDLIFLDIMMPEMDGYEVCRRLKDDPPTKIIPVIMVTALDDIDSRIKGLAFGANDFLTKPINSAELKVRAKNLLKVKEYEDFLKSYSEKLENEVAGRTSELNEALQKLKESQRELKEGYLDTIYRLTIVAEFKDEDSASHIKRVGLYCAYITGELGWPQDEIETVEYAAPMHDIGKVGIPAEILLKTSRLNFEEFNLMKTHTLIGGRILNNSKSHFLQMAEKIALTHHERYDGTGYPKGLKGEEIPIEGSILNLADQYDALRSRRPYKLPFDHDKTFNIITEGDGRSMPGHFDQKLLQVFKDTHKKFEEIYEWQ